MGEFGKSLENGISEMHEAASETSGNLATMSSGFDPLGLQNAFRTIQLQNEVIRQQQITIQALQKSEIQRLKRVNRRLRQRLHSKSVEE